MGRPQEATLGCPQNVKFQSHKDVGRGRPLALHRGPYGDAHSTSFIDVFRTSWRRYFAEWDKLKFSKKKKKGTKVTLNLSSNIAGDLYDKNNFRHKLSLANTQVLKLRKAFANNSSANI